MSGERWIDPVDLVDISPGEEDGICPLDVKDLACPAWGLGRSLPAPPWLPLILPPTEMLSLDPTWASACTAIFSGSIRVTDSDIFDPPMALTPSAWLIDPTSAHVATPANSMTISEQTTPSPKAAKPEPPPNLAAPASKTRGPGRDPTPGKL